METSNKINVLGKLPILASLAVNELEQIATMATFRRVAKFQFIFMPDEVADYVYILLKGRVKTGTFSAEGREVIKVKFYNRKPCSAIWPSPARPKETIMPRRCTTMWNTWLSVSLIFSN